MISTPSTDTSFDKYDEMRLHMEKVLSENLVTFDLSMRILCPLERAGIRTLGDLTKQTPKSLRQIKNLGKLSVERIEAFLKGLRLELAK